MKEIILVKLGEIVLKGLNRKSFESLLIKNLKRSLQSCGKFDIHCAQSTIYIAPQDDDVDMETAFNRVGKVFGIVAYNKAATVEKDLDKIKEMAIEYLGDELRNAKTFKVESKRADKKFPYKTPEISMEVGGYILSKFPHLKVDVKNPEIKVWVEVREKSAFIHSDAIRGAGGMPVGSSGKAAILISGGIDSPVAAWMIARRGVELTAIHFASPPYTSPRALDKVERLLKEVSQYSGRIKMHTVNFTKVQEQIRDNCPEELATLLMRRFMMKVSCAIAKKDGCHALITGESLGQVASQTMQSLAVTDNVCTMPVFRPLIGNDKSEIVEISRKINTFDISIEPFEDCCTVFTPKHPRTKPSLWHLEKAEELLDVDGLINECLETTEIITIHR
ncbi:MAG: tRNA uracil 4-sulfurtransferase ThiI [Clostridia bacterium]